MAHFRHDLLSLCLKASQSWISHAWHAGYAVWKPVLEFRIILNAVVVYTSILAAAIKVKYCISNVKYCISNPLYNLDTILAMWILYHINTLRKNIWNFAMSSHFHTSLSLTLIQTFLKGCIGLKCNRISTMLLLWLKIVWRKHRSGENLYQ